MNTPNTPNTLDLYTHCGSQHISLEDLQRLTTPPGTDTHILIPHYELFELALSSARAHGLELIQSVHAVLDGLYFAMMEVRSPYTDFSTIVGLRNSHDKKKSAALVCGTGVFVCDNLMFEGEIKIGRKHTVNMMRDLPQLVDGAMERLLEAQSCQSSRFDGYKGRGLQPTEVNNILIAAMDRGVISSGKIGRVLGEYREPAHSEFSSDTVWALLNAFTEVLKPREQGQDVFHLCDKTAKLTAILDETVN